MHFARLWKAKKNTCSKLHASGKVKSVRPNRNWTGHAIYVQRALRVLHVHWGEFVQLFLQRKTNKYSTFRECVFVSRAKFACVVLSSVVCPALLYFSTLFHKRHDFRKKKVMDIKYVLIFARNFVWNISNPKKNWATYDQERALAFT